MISSSKYKVGMFNKKRNDDENQPRVHTWEAWCTIFLFIYWLDCTTWGSNLDPQPWKYGVLTTGPPGDSHGMLFRKTRLPTTLNSQFQSIKAVSSLSLQSIWRPYCSLSAGPHEVSSQGRNIHPWWVIINCKMVTSPPCTGLTPHLSLERLSLASGDGHSFFKKHLDLSNTGYTGLRYDKLVVSFFFFFFFGCFILSNDCSLSAT